jgi:hypothetical protein
MLCGFGLDFSSYSALLLPVKLVLRALKRTKKCASLACFVQMAYHGAGVLF